MKKFLPLLLILCILLPLFAVTPLAAMPSQMTIADIAAASAKVAQQIQSAISEAPTNGGVRYDIEMPESITVGNYTMGVEDYTLMAAQAICAINDGNTSSVKIACHDISLTGEYAIGANINSVDKAMISDLATRAMKYGVTLSELPTSFIRPRGETTFEGRICIYSVAYIFAQALNAYAADGALPVSVTFTPTSFTVVSEEPTEPPIEIQDDWYTRTAKAAYDLEQYVIYHADLPETVNVGDKSVTMAELLYLCTQAIVNISEGTTSGDLKFMNLGEAQNPQDTITPGRIDKAEYIERARKIPPFCEENGVGPNYMTTSLGLMHYKEGVYFFAKIMSYYHQHMVLPEECSVSTWAITSDPSNIPTTTAPTTQPEPTESTEPTMQTLPGTVSDWYAHVAKASYELEQYVKKNENLPTDIPVGSKTLTMAEFLYVCCQAIVNIDAGNTAAELKFMELGEPENPQDAISTGKLDRAEYVERAAKIPPFCEANGVGPNYMTTSLGLMHYKEGVYFFAKIMSYYHVNKTLPNDCSVTAWSITSGTYVDGDATFGNDYSAYSRYLTPTNNCQSNNATIITVAKTGMNYSSGTYGGYVSPSSTYQAIFNLFEYLNDKTSYIYYANTYRGALGVWRDKGGNCCDMAHLMIACSRALGVPGRYHHDYCHFSTFSTGHVYAKILCGTTWYTADLVSNYNYLGYKTNTSAYVMSGPHAQLPF